MTNTLLYYQCFLQRAAGVPALSLLDSTVGHGLSPAHSLPLHLEGGAFVRGHTVVTGVQVGLDLLPNLLLRIQLLVRLSCWGEKNQSSNQGKPSERQTKQQT